MVSCREAQNDPVEAEMDDVLVCFQGTPACDRNQLRQACHEQSAWHSTSHPPGRLQATSLARATDPTLTSATAGFCTRSQGATEAARLLHRSSQRDARHSLRPSVAAKSTSPTRGSARSRHEHPIIEVSVADPWEIPGPGERMYGDLESWPMG